MGEHYAQGSDTVTSPSRSADRWEPLRSPLQTAFADAVRQCIADRPRRVDVHQSATLKGAMEHRTSYLGTVAAIGSELIVSAPDWLAGARAVRRLAGAFESTWMAELAAAHGRPAMDTLATFERESEAQARADMAQMRYLATRSDGDRRAARDSLAMHHAALADAVQALDTTGLCRAIPRGSITRAD